MQWDHLQKIKSGMVEVLTSYHSTKVRITCIRPQDSYHKWRKKCNGHSPNLFTPKPTSIGGWTRGTNGGRFHLLSMWLGTWTLKNRHLLCTFEIISLIIYSDRRLYFLKIRAFLSLQMCHMKKVKRSLVRVAIPFKCLSTLRRVD